MEMEQARLATPLSDEERDFLFEQRNSYHYRLFEKAILWLYGREANQLVQCKPESLVQKQGILIGLTMAKNLMTLGKMPEELPKKPDKK